MTTIKTPLLNLPFTLFVLAGLLLAPLKITAQTARIEPTKENALPQTGNGVADIAKLMEENKKLREENQRLRSLLSEPQAGAAKTINQAAKAEPAEKVTSQVASPAGGQAAATHWLTLSSGKRHNSSCRYFKTSKGRTCSADEGTACRVCGG